LLPSVAAGAAVELDDLRTACGVALDRVFAADPDQLMIIGGGMETARYGPDDFGSFDGFGVRATYPLGGIDALAVGTRMPLSLAVAAWLLHDRPTTPPRHGLAVAASAGPDVCRSLGMASGRRPDRLGLIVMGDGSAYRNITSEYADPRAEAFDLAVASALDAADPEALLAIDVGVATQLLVAGRAPWQVLAAAVLATNAKWRGEVLYTAAPYGINYLVASWVSLASWASAPDDDSARA
jgi:hypothetical protein